jgi:hypothetical protein
MRLPAGRLHDGRDGRATRPAQQRQHRSLLGAIARLVMNGLCPLALRSALGARSRLSLARLLFLVMSVPLWVWAHHRAAPSRRTTATPRRPTGAGGGEELGAGSIGPPLAATHALFEGDVERNVSNPLARFGAG